MIGPGQSVGNFTITERIGSGGMGEVFRARDTALDRDVAVKVVTEWTDHPGRLDRLRREARVLASLNHPGIAAIYGLEQVDGVPLLILELVDGPTLAERLKSGPVPLAEALAIARDAAEALAYAHQQSVVHRDLKPSNIKSPIGGRAKLLDFGLAKMTRPEPLASADELTANLTAEGAVFGTAPYMSPEQARGGAVDRKTDIWAFGCVLYEMLSGRRAFPTIAAVFESEPDWSALPAATPSSVRALLKRCVMKDAGRRAPDLADAAGVLASALDDLRRDRTGRPAWLLPAAAVLILAVVGALAWLQRSPATAPAASVAPAGPVVSLRRSVAALDLANLSERPEQAWISTALRELIAAALWSGDALRVISGEGVSQMSRDLELPAAEAFTLDTLARVRAHLGADLIVAGSYLAAGDRLQVSVRVQDTRTADTVTQVTETGAADDLIGVGERLGRRLRESLGEPLDEAAEPNAALPAGEAARHYIEGLGHARRFELQAARQALARAVALAPESALVRLAHARALSSLGYETEARNEASQVSGLLAGLPPRQRQRAATEVAVLTNDWPAALASYRAMREEQPDDPDAALGMLEAQFRSGDLKAALDTVGAIRRTLPQLDQSAVLDRLEAMIQTERAENGAALQLAQRAAARAIARGERSNLAATRVQESGILIRMARYQEAIDAARDAQRHYEASGNRIGAADALGTLAIVNFYLSDLDGARRLHEQELSVARQVGALRQESRALANLSMIDSLTGQLQSAVEREAQAIRIRREIGDQRLVVSSLHNAAELHQSLGELAEAEAAEREAETMARQLSIGGVLNFTIHGRADIAAARGDLATARGLYEEAITARTASGETAYAAASRLALATALLAAGQPVEAASLAEQAADLFRQVGDVARRGWALGYLALAEFERGNRERAGSLLDEGRPLVERATYVRARLTFAANEARILLASPDTVARARRVAETALTEAVRTGYVNRQLELRLVLGEAEAADPATRGAGLTRLRALEREARTRQYLVIADRAAAVLAGAR